MQDTQIRLREELTKIGRVAVAFSGGVDSTYLLKMAVDTLGSQNVLPLLAQAQLHSAREGREARDIAREMGVNLKIIPMDMHAAPRLVDNPPDRCYHCKRAVFTKLWEAARAEGYSVLADGTNADDAGDYRPGMRALAELAVKSPLKEAGMTKQDIRRASAALGLPTAAKPALACLATRIPYGTPLDEEVMRRIDEAEGALFELGFAQVRVRVHGEAARIEVPKEDIARAAAQAQEIVERVKGFRYVALDLKGYRMGSLNEGLEG